MKNKQKKNEFDSDFESFDATDESLKEDFADEDRSNAELTKAQRKMIKNAKKKGEDRSQLDHYDKSDLAEAKRYAKNHKFKVLFVVLTILLLLAVLTTVIIFAVTKIRNGPSKNDYRVFVGYENFENKEPTFELDYKDSNRRGQFYFDLKAISKYAGLQVGGEDKEGGSLTFRCEDGTYVTFTDGKEVAVINGTFVKVGGEVDIVESKKDEEAKCLIPFAFMQKLFSHKADGHSEGLLIKLKENNDIFIGKVTYDNGQNPPISFSEKYFTPATSADLFASLPNSLTESAANAIRTTQLKLVNKTYQLNSKEISSSGLISLSDIGCPVTDYIKEENIDFFDPTAALALKAMITDANKSLKGDDKILVSSAFRSYNYQKSVYQTYLRNYMNENDVSEAEAQKQIELFSARPGTSEHHTGLCADLVDEKSKNYELSQRFEETAAFEWLSKNAHKYGFILRYPKNKTNITKYEYEPWHYRFVGVQAATFIYEQGFTLEEFLGKTN